MIYPSCCRLVRKAENNCWDGDACSVEIWSIRSSEPGWRTMKWKLFIIISSWRFNCSVVGRSTSLMDLREAVSAQSSVIDIRAVRSHSESPNEITLTLLWPNGPSGAWPKQELIRSIKAVFFHWIEWKDNEYKIAGEKKTDHIWTIWIDALVRRSRWNNDV